MSEDRILNVMQMFFTKIINAITAPEITGKGQKRSNVIIRFWNNYRFHRFPSSFVKEVLVYQWVIPIPLTWYSTVVSHMFHTPSLCKLYDSIGGYQSYLFWFSNLSAVAQAGTLTASLRDTQNYHLTRHRFQLISVICICYRFCRHNKPSFGYRCLTIVTRTNIFTPPYFHVIGVSVCKIYLFLLLFLHDL